MSASVYSIEDGCSNEDVALQLSGHLGRNAELAANLLTRRVDLVQTRTIDLHFWAQSERDAQKLCELLTGNFYTITVPARYSVESSQWNVEAQVDTSVNQVISEKFTNEIIMLACSVSSRFDGWGTQI